MMTNEPSLYERVRNWADNVGIDDPVKEMLCLVEECGELDEAMQRYNDNFDEETGSVDSKCVHDVLDAIGDIAVCAIAEHYILVGKYAPTIEDQPRVSPPRASAIAICGTIAEGLRKPKKRQQAIDGCVEMLAYCNRAALGFGFTFERDCLGLVVPVIESRVADGRLVNGTFVKGADL